MKDMCELWQAHQERVHLDMQTQLRQIRVLKAVWAACCSEIHVVCSILVVTGIRGKVRATTAGGCDRPAHSTALLHGLCTASSNIQERLLSFEDCGHLY